MSNLVTVINHGTRAQVITIVGARGPQGPGGPGGAGLSITGAVPDASSLPPTGVGGDIYVTRDDGHGHAWTASGWSDIGSIAIQGPPGKNGNIHFKGTGAPGVILGAEPGDSYLDLQSGLIYVLS